MKKLLFIFLILSLCSCGSVTKINGITVNNSHKRTTTRKDTGYFIAAGLIGYAATLHFKTKGKE